MGMHSFIFDVEDFSEDAIQGWIEFNRETLILLEKDSKTNLHTQVDHRLLQTQIKKELALWQEKQLHRSSLSLYSELINRSTKSILDAEYLGSGEKLSLICDRFGAINFLCQTAMTNLGQVERQDLDRGMRQLKEAALLYKSEIADKLNTGNSQGICTNYEKLCQETIDNIKTLTDYVESELRNNAIESKPVLGYEKYADQLSLYTDSHLSPEELADMALAEIELVRKLIINLSKDYLLKEYPGQVLPGTEGDIILGAFNDMEKDAPINAGDYLEFWQNLSTSASRFLEENQIATLPKNETLEIKTAPETAGPAARIGWVSSAPPFAPNPVTTLYLPSIPDTLPEQEQRDFWASFNKPFNRMIVIHELFPGHYMQIKIARETAHPIRLIFPYGPYIEGWATFCEIIALDHGWEEHNPLTRLAHLRKRIENANRAYTSVMVHCYGWDEEKVMQFSTETSLLAPQFAKSLWGRLMRSPMQMTSYFLGGQQFRDLYQVERDRLNQQFELKRFMDTILREGPITIQDFYSIFELTMFTDAR